MKKNVFFVVFLLSLTLQSQDSIRYYARKTAHFYHLGKLEKSRVFLQKELAFLQRQDNLEEFYYAYWDFFMLHPDKNRLPILDKALADAWRQPKTESERVARLHLLINKAYHLKKFNAIYPSVIAYERALAYYQKQDIKSYDITEYCLKPLANNCTRIGDYGRAEDVLLQALQRAKAKQDAHQTAGISNNLSIIYQSQGQYKKAIGVLEESLKVPRLNHTDKSRLLSELGRNLYHLKAYKRAVNSCAKAIRIQKISGEKDKPILIKTLTTQALCFIAVDKPDAAKTILEESLRLALQVYEPQDREIAKIYRLIAETYATKGDFIQSLRTFQQALQVLLPGFHPVDEYALPETDFLYPENSFKEIFDGRARLLSRMQKWELALASYDRSFAVEALLRDTYSSEESKLIQQAEIKNRSEQAIAVCKQLYRKTQNPEFAIKALRYVEESKAAVLRNALQNKRFMNPYQNDSLVRKESVLQTEKARLNQAIVTQKTRGDKKALNRLITRRSKLDNQLQLLNEKIRKRFHFHPKFERIFSLDSLRENLLQDHQIIVSYFVGKNQTEIFSIDKKHIYWRSISNPDYTALLRKLFAFYEQDKGQLIINQIDDFVKVSKSLYDLLLQPELARNTVESCLIIPDGNLSFVPFEALLTEEIHARQFASFPFLLQKLQMSYAYSIGIMQNNQYEMQTDKNIGFFPAFDKHQRGLEPLPYTLEEAGKLTTSIEMHVFMNENATLAHFLEEADNKQIIHLSTHAHSGTLTHPPSVEFWDKSLFLPEIFGYKMQADLLVMSACETGIGATVKGEGAMSLAWGFSLAGIHNLVVSLWEVNDQSTATLMGSFYRYMAQDKSFEKALMFSKRDYLSDKTISNIRKSPYYWSGFVAIRNTGTPFVMQANHSYKYRYAGLIFFVLIIGIALWVWRYKR